MGSDGGNILGCLLYADDLVVIAENEIMLQDMQNIIVGEYGWNFKVKFSSDKRQVMVVEAGEWEMDRWRLGDSEIKRTNEYKYLGITVTLTVNGFDKPRGDKRTKVLQWWGRLSGLPKQRVNMYEVTRGSWKAIAVPSSYYVWGGIS